MHCIAGPDDESSLAASLRRGIQFFRNVGQEENIFGVEIQSASDLSIAFGLAFMPNVSVEVGGDERRQVAVAGLAE